MFDVTTVGTEEDDPLQTLLYYKRWKTLEESRNRAGEQQEVEFGEEAIMRYKIDQLKQE